MVLVDRGRRGILYVVHQLFFEMVDLGFWPTYIRPSSSSFSTSFLYSFSASARTRKECEADTCSALRSLSPKNPEPLLACLEAFASASQNLIQDDPCLGVRV